MLRMAILLFWTAKLVRLLLTLINKVEEYQKRKDEYIKQKNELREYSGRRVLHSMEDRSDWKQILVQ